MRYFAAIFLVTISVLGQAIPVRPHTVLINNASQSLPELSAQLRRYDLVELDAAKVAEQVRQTGQLSVPTSEGTLALSLVPNDMRAANYSAVEVRGDGTTHLLERTPASTYKGTVRGEGRSQARFTIDGNVVEGMIITAGQTYFIEPASRYASSLSRTDYVVYRGSDVIRDFIGTCPSTLSEEVRSEVARASSAAPVVSKQFVLAPDLVSPALEVELATEADNEFVAALGSTQAANNEILSIVNMVDGIYQSEIGLTFKVVYQRAWPPATPDPYSDTTDVTALLPELRAQWNANPPAGAPARDVVHMWTGKSTNAAGFAFTGVVCRDDQFTGGSASYGLSQWFPQAVAKVIIPAHEMGHNFLGQRIRIRKIQCMGSAAPAL